MSEMKSPEIDVKNQLFQRLEISDNEIDFRKPLTSGEHLYIFKRRCKAFLYGIPFILCRIFPVKQNKIVFWTFEGTGGFGCSPRYIAEKLLDRKDPESDSYDLCWLVSDMNKAFPEDIRKIKDTLWNRAYHMTTARLWVGNTRTTYGTRKRKETIYLQTWHGSLSLKPIGLYRGKLFSRMAYIVSKADSDLIDVAISGSKYCTAMWPKGLLYDGRIETIGTPRNDVLINDVEDKHRQSRKDYGLPEDAKIAIYAPTFRGGSQGTKRSVSEGLITLDFRRVLDALERRFGGTWYMFLRLHPQLSVFMKGMTIGNQKTEEASHDSDLSDRLIDVTQRPDMNEIMATTDIIITDYSTCIFEGFLTGQPGFIYADDWNAYIEDRGNLMLTENEIPFSIARDNDELVNNIIAFDEAEYNEKAADFMKIVGMNEDGHSAERAAEMIRKLCFG